MFNLLFSSPLAFAILFPTLLISITIHEFAHAWVADHLGDPTPRYQGRVTLNPLAHLDPLGTIAMLLVGFGWGRPVEYDPYNLKNPLRDTALIAAAGPFSNLVIASLLAVIIRVGLVPSELFAFILLNIITINVVLAIFNLIPVYPLDGSKIILALLPRTTAIEFDTFMHRYGMFVLLLLIFPWVKGASPASQLITPIIHLITQLMVGVPFF